MKSCARDLSFEHLASGLIFILTFTLLTLSTTEAAEITNTDSHLIPCEPGWYLFGNRCYKVFEKTQGIDWKSAKVRCADEHGSLVSIESKELQDFLTTFFLLDVVKPVWIGLNDLEVESRYTWADGSIVNYTHWGDGQPSDERMYKDEDCVEMLYLSRKGIGRWNDISCDGKRTFICQRNNSEQAMNHDPRFCTGDNDGAWKYQNSCYHTVSEEMSWNDAEDHCQTTLNGHLLTILDSNVDLFLDYTLSGFKSEFWIGIKIQDAAQQMWSSGWIVDFEKFDTLREHNIIGNCVYMTEKRVWTTQPCNRKLPFICEVSNVKPPPLKQAPEQWSCPELSQDWVDLGGDNCYIFETRPKKWHEANFACMKKGGHLASIHSVAETNTLNRHLKNGPEVMHIGLHRSLSDYSVFEWADGTLLDYQNWIPGEPNNGNDGCVEMWTDVMEWGDIPCGAEIGYICSAKKVPSFLQKSNVSALINNQLEVESSTRLFDCFPKSSAGTEEKITERHRSENITEGHPSANVTLTVLLVAVIVLSVGGISIYVYKNHYARYHNRRLKKESVGDDSFNLL